MPRRLIPFAPELYYHIYNRGNNREKIFFEPDNYLYFLKKIKEYLVPVANIVVYCLMPTHYHVVGRVRDLPAMQTSEVLKPKPSPISTAMMRLSVSYTKAVNKRFQRVGVLFQGQFQAKPVLTSAYLLNLCRYIHANPVKDGIVADIAQWPYSIPTISNGSANAMANWWIKNLSVTTSIPPMNTANLYWSIYARGNCPRTCKGIWIR